LIINFRSEFECEKLSKRKRFFKDLLSNNEKTMLDFWSNLLNEKNKSRLEFYGRVSNPNSDIAPLYQNLKVIEDQQQQQQQITNNKPIK
jgi:hypothetical protein